MDEFERSDIAVMNDARRPHPRLEMEA